jgi:hypothetical protein
MRILLLLICCLTPLTAHADDFTEVNAADADELAVVGHVSQLLGKKLFPARRADERPDLWVLQSPREPSTIPRARMLRADAAPDSADS